MVFSAPLFLFGFLPVVLAAHALAPRACRNLLLLAASLFFYAWGEKFYIGVLLASIGINYLAGIIIDSLRRPLPRRAGLGVAVTVNIGLLGSYKYANFLIDNLNAVLPHLHIPPVVIDRVHLPLGISFFTFHALSYVIDVYRREVKSLRNVVNFALYIAFFPQSIAGPIIRFHDVAAQLARRQITFDGWTAGVSQFILGLSKKMLVANTLAVPADAIFGLPGSALTCGLAWLGAACYTLQIYFDFSGYSDMAIGLARMFGFEFRANFDYPYVSQSITEFWRRWHISLSSWFRDYLYIPLGGNRRGPARTYLNLLTVFLLCGLWHGARWTFIAWGLYHGAFLVLERLGLDRRLARLPAALRHAYALLAVVVGWVFFKAETFHRALAMLRAMAGLCSGRAVVYDTVVYLRHDVVLALVGGGVLSLPVLPWLAGLERRLSTATAEKAWGCAALEAACGLGTTLVLSVLLLCSAMLLAGNTYNPFIYFRF
jgi:alginate O-acetyltransferase complex protein AlgI